MAPVKYYVNYLMLVRDDDDSGYYVFLSTNASYQSMYVAHVADSSGCVTITGGTLRVIIDQIFTGIVTLSGFASNSTKTLTIY